MVNNFVAMGSAGYLSGRDCTEYGSGLEKQDHLEALPKSLVTVPATVTTGTAKDSFGYLCLFRL